MGNNNNSNSKRKRSQQEQKEHKEKARRKEKEKEEQEIFIFGYESQLYKNTTHLKETSLLIPWQHTNENNNNNSVLLDRYDIRHLIEDENILYYLEKKRIYQYYDNNNNKKEQVIDIEEVEDKEEIELLNKERYQDLESDETLVFNMSRIDRIEYIEGKLDNKKSNKKGNCIQFNYNEDNDDDDEEEEEEEEEEPSIILSEKQLNLLKHYNIKMENPNDFKIPNIPSDDDINNNEKNNNNNNNNNNNKTKKKDDSEEEDEAQDDRILIKEVDKIAQLISSQSNPKLYEIRYQVLNRHLTFLNQQHIFHPFYQHVLNYYIHLKRQKKLENENKKTGSLVDYASSSSDEDDE